MGEFDRTAGQEQTQTPPPTSATPTAAAAADFDTTQMGTTAPRNTSTHKDHRGNAKQLEIKERQRNEWRRSEIYERVEANAASPRKAAGMAKMRID